MLVRLRIVLLLVDLALFVKQVGKAVRPFKWVVLIEQDPLGHGKLFIHKFTLFNLIIAELVHVLIFILVSLQRYLIHLVTHVFKKGQFAHLFLYLFRIRVNLLLFFAYLVLLVNNFFVFLVHLFNSFLFDRLLDDILKILILFLRLFLFFLITFFSSLFLLCLFMSE